MKIADFRGSDGKLFGFAWPGGYEIAYITADGGTLCYRCANRQNGSEATEDPDEHDAQSGWLMIGCDILEDGCTTCDHCDAKMGPLDDGHDNGGESNDNS